MIESDKAVVLGEAVVDEIGFYSLQEVPIEHGINDEVKCLLNTVPDLVNDMVAEDMSVWFVAHTRRTRRVECAYCKYPLLGACRYT